MSFIGEQRGFHAELADLRGQVEANSRQIEDADTAALAAEVRRLNHRLDNIEIETRTLIGEREMRIDEFLRHLRGICEAFNCGLNDLIAEW